MMKYSESFLLSDEDFDNRGNLLPYRALVIFQTLANMHADILGVGFEEMLSRNLLWVITQIKYRVCGKLYPGQRIKGETWPLQPSRLGYERQHKLSDDDGNPLIIATSNWVLIDTQNRRLASAERVYPGDDYCTDNNFGERTRRLRDFEASGECFDICADESFIDRNGHVNNTNYAAFVQRALGDFGGEIDTFQIDYINEVMCGQTVHILHAVSDGTTLVKGLSDNGERMFTCSLIFK